LAVALLLDRLPLHCWTDQTHTPSTRHWSVRLPIIPSPAGSPPLPVAKPQDWVLDTGFSGEAFAWRHHLDAAGLDPDQERDLPIALRWSATGQRTQVPVREADLWIVSNCPDVGPFCMYLDGGIAFIDRHVTAPDPEFHRALIGMRALRRAQLTVEINFVGLTVSIRTP
jgi:hypothetical protein